MALSFLTSSGCLRLPDYSWLALEAALKHGLHSSLQSFSSNLILWRHTHTQKKDHSILGVQITTSAAKCFINSIKQQHRLPRTDIGSLWRFSRPDWRKPHVTSSHHETSQAPFLRESSYSPLNDHCSCGVRACITVLSGNQKSPEGKRTGKSNLSTIPVCVDLFVCLEDVTKKNTKRTRIYKMTYSHMTLYKSENKMNIYKTKCLTNTNYWLV